MGWLEGLDKIKVSNVGVIFLFINVTVFAPCILLIVSDFRLLTDPMLLTYLIGTIVCGMLEFAILYIFLIISSAITSVKANVEYTADYVLVKPIALSCISGLMIYMIAIWSAYGEHRGVKGSIGTISSLTYSYGIGLFINDLIEIFIKKKK